MQRCLFALLGLASLIAASFFVTFMLALGWEWGFYTIAHIQITAKASWTLGAISTALWTVIAIYRKLP